MYRKSKILSNKNLKKKRSKKMKKKRNMSKSTNPWLNHVKQVKSKNKSLSLKKIFKLAKKTYKKNK